MTRPSPSRTGAPAGVAFRFDAQERPPAVALAHGLAEDGAIDRPEQVVAAGEAPDRGANEQLERDGRGHRIAGQPEQQDRRSPTRPIRDPERERLAGLDGDPPQVDPADPLDGGLDHVVRADRHAAGHDQRVGAGVETASEAGQDVVEVVGRDAEVDRLAAGRRDEGAQAGPVGIGDARRAEVGAGRADLVARREHGDPGSTVDEDVGRRQRPRRARRRPR